MNLAKLFTGQQPKPRRRVPPRAERRNAGLADYQRTYGEQDGRTVFQAAQIKAKRKKK